jgi:hypothetical protein
MNDSADPSKKREAIRVIDRRPFTGTGEPRHPDLPREDAPPAPPRTQPRAPGPAATRPAGEEPAPSPHFKNLVLNLATTAAAGLGEIPSPFTGQTEVDLESARQVIDLLRALQAKTRGNLTPEEAELVDSLLYDLQVKYVRLQSRGSKPS